MKCSQKLLDKINQAITDYEESLIVSISSSFMEKKILDATLEDLEKVIINALNKSKE